MFIIKKVVRKIIKKWQVHDTVCLMKYVIAMQFNDLGILLNDVGMN